MRQRVLILHGWGGSDYPHWQSKVSSKIAQDYGCVSFLPFSAKDNPNKDIWLKELQEELEAFKPTVVICHSIANILWFHLCNSGFKIDLVKLFLVAIPSMKCDIKELSSFYPCTLPKNLLAKSVELISSDNDPYISYDEVLELKNELNVALHIVPNGGHINVDSGFGEFEYLLNKLH